MLFQMTPVERSFSAINSKKKWKPWNSSKKLALDDLGKKKRFHLLEYNSCFEKILLKTLYVLQLFGSWKPLVQETTLKMSQSNELIDRECRRQAGDLCFMVLSDIHRCCWMTQNPSVVSSHSFAGKWNNTLLLLLWQWKERSKKPFLQWFWKASLAPSVQSLG